MPGLFTALAERRPTPSQVRHGRAVCMSCPFLIECGDYAVDVYEEYGMWGGLLPGERRRRYLKLRKDDGFHAPA